MPGEIGLIDIELKDEANWIRVTGQGFDTWVK
jgi:hypothetical protein